MTNPIYIVYMHTCKTTGKSYIGQTRKTLTKRWNEHTSLAKKQNIQFHFHKAIRKYGVNDWYHKLLFTTCNYNLILLTEIAMITMYDTFNNGYNMTIGGEGVISKTAISGNQHYLYNKRGNETPNFGIKRTNETKLKMSIAQLGKKNYRFKGYYHTPWGIFESSTQAAEASPYKFNHQSILNWCKKNSNNIITWRHTSQSPYLKSLPESPLGKTFREIGFGFEPT